MSLIINFVDAKVDSLLPLHLLQPLVVDGVNVFILGRKDAMVCQVLWRTVLLRPKVPKNGTHQVANLLGSTA